MHLSGLIDPPQIWMNRLRAFLALAPVDRHLLLRAACWLAVIRVGVWLLPFQTLRRLVAGAAQASRRPSDARRLSPDRVAWGVVVASQYVPGAGSCLVQALAGRILLAQSGIPGRVHIGFARDAQGQIEGHAWLESQGRIVIGGSELERYILLSAFEGESS
jgi:hypothetical protein